MSGGKGILPETSRHFDHRLLTRGQQLVLGWDWLRWLGKWDLALMGTVFWEVYATGSTPERHTFRKAVITG